MKPLHQALARQLRRLGLNEERAPDARRWQALLERIGRKYAHAERKRALLKQAQEARTREFEALNVEFHRQREELESRIAERTSALAASEARFRSLTSLGSDWYWEQDREYRFTSIAGDIELSPGHAKVSHIGRTHWEMPGYDVPEGGWETHRAVLDARRPFKDLLLCFQVADGGIAWASISGEPFCDANGGFAGYRGIGRDVTQQKQAEERVQRLARFDPLTGLYNRPMFFERLDHALTVAKRAGTNLALIFIDLDRFKNVNDTFGHQAGDDVLKVMAARLAGIVREADTIARLGGDEFIVLAEQLGAPRDASDLAQRLVDVLAEPVAVGNMECHLGASIGVATFPNDGLDGATLLKKADIAMYRAKDAGRNNFQFYSDTMNRPLIERMVMGASLKRALEQRQFVLLYQPKISVATGELTGVEALVRWQHPEHGLLPPDEFIPIAEETGSIRQLGRFVLHTACAQSRAWQDAGLPPVPIAVNLSAREFADERLVFEVAQALALNDIEPRLLEVEITESLIIDDSERALETLAGLKAMGVRVAIDDFGTGHSSLARLSKLPVDSLKIDGQLIRDIATDPTDAAIASAVIAMSRSLRLTSIAEHVEHADQVEFLRRTGCDEMQGFLLGRPMPGDELAKRMRESRGFARPLALVEG